MTDEEIRRATIARYNDRLRSTGEDGWTYMSSRIAKLPIAIQEDVIRAIRLFDDFTPENDPHGEHDGATLDVGEFRICWRINYYTPGRRDGDKMDAADPAVTLRVMTIMFVEAL
ncbi:MAG: hypothetical protein CVT74_15310 [Alphaproteobacteria bacterium HGW-Alphaproteobacteria-13]|jgi:hypothetical protein|nr:MAG: hypothetical protein CVT74_15310 [Alphaproteobacteria bacterium HGW-Alphaproteobacteria-13]